MSERSSGWGREFDEPIALPGGRKLVTLRDAALRDGLAPRRTAITGMAVRAELAAEIAGAAAVTAGRELDFRNWISAPERPNRSIEEQRGEIIIDDAVVGQLLETFKLFDLIVRHSGNIPVPCSCTEKIPALVRAQRWQLFAGRKIPFLFL
jgi:hypothetical protein